MLPCPLKSLDLCHHGALKQWVQTEQSLVGAQLESALWCHMSSLHLLLDHPTVGETWWLTQKPSGDEPIAIAPLPLTPIVDNAPFSPGVSDPRFQEVKVVERSQVQHFLTNGRWKTRQQNIVA